MPWSDPSPRTAVALLLVVLVFLGLWPYLEILGWLPWGVDATKWVIRGSLDEPGWWHWATASKHFVGYRPVTALSYVANHAITGYEAWGYRATDLALHLATGALTFVVYRDLTGDRSVLGLIPVAVVLLHPATEEVVPFAARRSYLLASTLGLGGVAAWVRALAPARPSPAWALLAVELVVLALLSNELAFVLPPILVLLALHRGHSLRDTALLLLPLALFVGLALARRYEVLGTLGGYSKRYFAFVRGGHPMWKELTRWEPGAIAEAAWRYTFAPNGVSGAPPMWGRRWAPLGAALSTAWLLWVGLGVPALRWSERALRVRWVLIAWLLGVLAIVVASQTWFWRQATAMLPPLGMLVALGLRDAIEGAQRSRWHAVPLAAGLASFAALAWNGPLPTLDPRPHEAARDGTPAVETFRRLTGQIEEPAVVWLVVPLNRSSAHIARIWAGRFGREQQLELHLLGHLKPAADPERAALTLRRQEGQSPALVLERGLVFAEGVKGATISGGRSSLSLDRLWRSRKPSYVVAIDRDDAWMVRVPEPQGDLPAEALPAEDTGAAPSDTGL